MSQNKEDLQPFTITNCDREPIQFIEQSQQHGVIIICNYKEDRIIQISENCDQILNLQAQNIIDRSLSNILPKDAVNRIYKNLTEEKTLYPEEVSFNKNKFLAIPHLTESENLIIDLEPFNAHINPIQFQEELTKILNEIKDTDALAIMSSKAVSLIKNLYDYDRVMMYRFDEKWNGEVIAESKNDNLETWLGLHFPATDIPQKARELFLTQGVRMICNVNYTPSNLYPKLTPPVNLSKSELRGVSPIHIEYLTNMNVQATLTIAIILHGKLWGLIACHHYDSKFINYHQRQTCKFLAQVFTNKLALQQSNSFRKEMNASEKIRKQLLLQLNSIEDSTTALTNFQSKFTDLVRCSGGAIYNQKKITLVGKTPSEKQVKKIIKKVIQNNKKTIFYTKQLCLLHENANKYTALASGVLSIRIGNEDSYILWFRPEAATSVDWGGKPEKSKHIENGIEYLHPRKSFERWTQNVSGIANPWQSYDIEAATKLQDTINHVLIKKQKDKIKNLNESLVEVNKELETFSYSVSHDLRAPLRGIDGYTRILIDNYIENLDSYGQKALKTILNSAKEMDLLIEDILSYAKVGQNKLNLSRFSTKTVINNLIDSQNIATVYPNTKIVLNDNLPSIIADKRMITQVFSNLLSNATKYSSKTEKPYVEIGILPDTKHTIFYVKDNGVGFDISFNSKIFDVFSRANSSKDFSGTGIGLATAKKVIEKHNGEIWAEAEVNKGATFYFYLDISES